MTMYSEVYASFTDLIIRDTKFFIKNHSMDLVKQISEKRMFRLLKHAITNMMLVEDKRDFEINFMAIMNNESMVFEEDLTMIEIDLLAYFMWQCYIEEEVVTRLQALKTLSFKDDEIAAFSPNGNIKEFRNTYNLLVEENKKRVREYKRRRRKDFMIKTHNFIFNE